MSEVSTNYFLVTHTRANVGSNPVQDICILEQKGVGDSIGKDAKDNAFINGVTFCPVKTISLYTDKPKELPIVQAKHLNAFFMERGIVPY